MPLRPQVYIGDVAIRRVLLYSNQSNTVMPPKGSEGPQPGVSIQSFFTVPAPIKQLFDKFPLVTYPPNELPGHLSARRYNNQLFVFTDATSARRGRPSYNPQCLKWQVRFPTKNPSNLLGIDLPDFQP